MEFISSEVRYRVSHLAIRFMDRPYDIFTTYRIPGTGSRKPVPPGTGLDFRVLGVQVSKTG